jgi:hypothetical protein
LLLELGDLAHQHLGERQRHGVELPPVVVPLDDAPVAIEAVAIRVSAVEERQHALRARRSDEVGQSDRETAHASAGARQPARRVLTIASTIRSNHASGTSHIPACAADA